jgi:hypothetical protein
VLIDPEGGDLDSNPGFLYLRIQQGMLEIFQNKVNLNSSSQKIIL